MTGKLVPTIRRRSRVPRTSPPFKRIDLGRSLIAIGTVVVLAALLSFHFIPDRIKLAVGDRVQSDIRAPRSVSYIDTEATVRAREDHASRIPAVFDLDPAALAMATGTVSDVFDTVRRVRNSNDISGAARRQEVLGKELGSLFSNEELKFLLEEKPAVLDRMQATLKSLVVKVMSRQIRDETQDVIDARKELSDRASTTVTASTELHVMTVVGNKAVRANYRVNGVRTKAIREESVRRRPAITGEVKAGDIVARQGEPFTQLHLDICKALGLITPRLDITTFVSVVGLSIATVLLIGVFLRIFQPSIYNNHNLLLLLAAIVCFSVLGLKVFGQVLGIPLSFTQVGYFGLMMVVAAAMIISVLLNPQLAILVAALLSGQSGLIMNHELRFALMTLVSSLSGIYSVTNIRARGHLLRATTVIAFANVSLVWILGGLLSDPVGEMVSGSVWAVISAAFATCLFWFAVTFLERPFGILTHAWLLELSLQDHPLLRELCLTAPGTYAHSVMVGNLAEAAAEEIGADALFCRVASYYHDIGKINRPHCFIENQHGDNIHMRLNPSLSALIISSHVKDGLELATRYRLPDQIKAIVCEHHGTSLIRYFYNQALATSGEDRHDPILEQHYRYEGPKPQSRESGIIMLADTVEAALRTLDKPSQPRIQSRVQTLIQDIMNDGQLDECDLTFKDIRKIEEAFSRQLCAMYHARIDYPEIGKSDSLANVGNNLLSESESLKSSYSNGSNYPELPKPQR